MTLVYQLQRFYAHETNVTVSSFWDIGWRIQIGDPVNGFKAEIDCVRDLDGEGAEWLREFGDSWGFAQKSGSESPLDPRVASQLAELSQALERALERAEAAEAEARDLRGRLGDSRGISVAQTGVSLLPRERDTGGSER